MHLRRPVTALWLLIAVAPAVGAPATDAATGAGLESVAQQPALRIELALEDQHGEPVVLPFPETVRGPDGGPPVAVLVLADREGAEGNREWAEALAGRYREHLRFEAAPALVVIAVAHLDGVPAVLRGLVRRAFRRDGALPPIALDWRGDTARQVGLTPGTPNVLVLDRSGQVRARVDAPASPDARRRVFAVLDELLGGS